MFGSNKLHECPFCKGSGKNKSLFFESDCLMCNGSGRNSLFSDPSPIHEPLKFSYRTTCPMCNGHKWVSIKPIFTLGWGKRHICPNCKGSGTV